ncbi:hypothetical protein, partial [Nocardia salmonicida]|uniref:hypothetical protein n=1 Tax=Nocardia salmonicida TaxID=53431 RepID=UPI0033FB3AAF
CLAVACVLFPLGVWGRQQAESLVVDAVEGEEREQRIAVLRRGAVTCQVLGVVFTAAAFWLQALR